MPAPILQLADAIVAKLSAAMAANQFSLQATPERRYFRNAELVKLGADPVLWVGVNALESEFLTRLAHKHQPTIGVAFLQRVASFDNADLDPLVAFAEELHAWFWHRDQRIWDVPSPRTSFVSAAYSPLYVPELLEEEHLFVAPLTCVFAWGRSDA